MKSTDCSHLSLSGLQDSQPRWVIAADASSAVLLGSVETPAEDLLTGDVLTAEESGLHRGDRQYVPPTGGCDGQFCPSTVPSPLQPSPASRTTVSGSNEIMPQWLKTAILIILSLTAANLLAWRTIEPDLWGHIQYGEDWITSGRLPVKATHTFSTPEHPWVNHENLFELSVAWLQRQVDGIGLMILKCLAGLALLYSMIRVAARNRVPLITAAVCMIPVTWGLAEFWLARPQLFSFLFFGMMLVSFEKAFANWNDSRTVRSAWLWLNIPMMVLWTNSHGGFAAGLCVLIAVLGLRSLELIREQRWNAASTVRQFAAIAATACLSVLVNPYGYELPWWMYVSLRQPRPEVSEWVSVMDSGVTLAPFLVLTLLSACCLFLSRVRRDWVHFTVLALIAWQAYQHVRHVAFLAIVFGYWMPVHMHSLWLQLVEWRPSLGSSEPISPRAARWIQAQVLLVMIGLSTALGWSFLNFGVPRNEYPVTAFEFMERENIHGRLVVTFDWAQYALAALNPKTTVGFDGRYDTCYPQEVVDMNFDLLFGNTLQERNRSPQSGPIDPRKVLSFGNPDLVLLDRRTDQPGIAVVESDPDWVMLYQDGLSILWGKWDAFDDPSSSRYVPVERRQISDQVPQGIAAWPGFPVRSGVKAFFPEVSEKSVRLADRL